MAWKGTQQNVNLITKAEHMIVTQRRTLSDGADNFFRFFCRAPALLEIELVKLEGIPLSFVRVAYRRHTIMPYEANMI